MADRSIARAVAPTSYVRPEVGAAGFAIEVTEQVTVIYTPSNEGLAPLFVF